MRRRASAHGRSEERWPWLAGPAVAAGLLGIYVAGAARELTWANQGVDGGDLVTAVATLGIPHPTGYPTYVLMGRLFTLLPVGEPAFQVTLLSAAAAAATAGLLAALVTSYAGSSPPVIRLAAGITAGLALGLSPTFWSQALIAEVHALQALFILVSLHLIWRLSERERPLGWGAVGLFLLYGLGLGNHVTLVLMAPVLGAAALRRWRLRGGRKWIGRGALALLLGLGVYLYLPLRARADPPVNWGDPNSLQGFLWVVGARPYQGLAFSLPGSQVPWRISAWAGMLMHQFSLLGVGLAVVGLVYGTQRRSWLNWTSLWMILAYSGFAIGYDTADSFEYLIPAYIATAWLLGQGVILLMQWLHGAQPGWAPILPALLLLGLGLRAPGIWWEVDPRQDRRAAEFAATVRAHAPAEALMLTWTAADSFPLWYEQFALGRRQDLRIVVVPLAQFGWYRANLADTYPYLQQPAIAPANPRAWAEALAASYPGPVCTTNAEDPGASELVLLCGP